MKRARPLLLMLPLLALAPSALAQGVEGESADAPGIEPRADEDYLLDDESWWESVALGADEGLAPEVDVGTEPGIGVGNGELFGEEPLIGDEVRPDVGVPDVDEEEPGPMQMGPMDLLSPTGEPLRIGPPTAPGPGGILR